MGFSENYLERRKKRTGNGGTSSAAGARTDRAADSFTARYLERRAAGLPSASIQTVSGAGPRTLSEAIAEQWKAQAAEKKAEPAAPARTVRAEEPYRGPAWAQEMAGRYRPTAADLEKRDARTGVDWRGIPVEYSPDKKPEATVKDWAGLAGNTLMAGVGQVSKASSAALSAAEQLVSRPLGWLLGNPELYKDAPLYKLDKAVDQDVAAIQEDLAGSAGKTGKAGELIAKFGPATVAALPQAALAYLTAGQSLAAQTSTAGLQAASTAAQLTGGAAAANTVLQAVKGMAANPSFQYSFLNTVGGEYQQALEDGADPTTAYAYAALSSLANSVVEVGGGIDTLPETIRGKDKGQLLEWVKSMFDEGKEEVIQGAISQMMQNGIYQKGNQFFSMTDENAVVNPGRMAEEFAGGAVVGGVLGGGQMAVNAAIDSAARRAAQRDVQAQAAQGDTGIPAEAQAGAEARENRDAAPSSPVEETTITTAAPAEPVAAGSQSAEQMTGRLVRMGELSETAARLGELLGRVKDGQTLTEAELREVQNNPNSAKLIGAVQELAARRAAEEPAAGADTDKNVKETASLTGGFVESENGAEVSKADRRMLNDLGKITRSEIRTVTQEELNRLAGKPGADGVQLGNRIYISETAEQPMMEIARHELTHRLQEAAPAEYGAFRDYVARVYREDGSLDRYIQSIRDSRASAGIELSDAEIMDEIAADYAGQLLVDERAVRRLAGENRGLLDRMLDGLREIITKIRRAFGGKADAQTEELERAARLWENALRSAADSRGGDSAVEPEELSLPKPRFSFGGRNARQADSGSLVRAQILESQGATAEDIRKDTGWFRGMDGLWRFEIDDSRMEYSQWGDMRRSDRAEYARFRELEGKFIEGTITEAEQAELRGLLDGGHGSGRAAEQGTLRLADYIRHDELFRNYPQLKGATLRFAELEPGAQGSYNPETNTITISEKLQKAPEDTIIHEVQHAIQMAEGFAKGSSPEYWYREAVKRLDQADVDVGRLKAEFREKVQNDSFLQELTEKRERGDISDDEFYRQYDEHFETDPEYAKLEERIMQAEKDSLRYSTESDYSLYRNTAGEIEARDVAGRRRMAAEERRQMPPAMGDENTVFAEGSGGSSSVDYDEDNRQLSGTEENIREDDINTAVDDRQKRTFSEEIMAQLTGEDAKTDGAGPTELKGLSLPTLEGDGEAGSVDTRFSMKGDADIQKEVERLRRQNQRLKEQTKRTDAPRRNQEAVEKEAYKLLREYSSTYDRTELANRLKTLWDHQADRYGGAPWVREKAPTKEAIRQEAKEIAVDILANNEEQVNTLHEQYSELRKELRTRGISIAPEYRADLESAGGYEGLRKQYFGRLRLSKDGAAVDQVYDDLADRYPELFPDDILHPADQLVRITDVLDELEPVMGNTYEKEMDQAAEYLAGDLLERFYDVPQKALTYADKQAQKMAEARKKDREEFEARLYRKKRETETRIKRVQEKFKERDRKRIENQNASQRRETIRRHADRLGRMLLRPTDKRHVPEELRGAALKFVQSLNLESGYSRDLFGKQVTAEQGEAQGAVPTMRSEAARALQEKLKKLAENGGMTIDPDMDGYLDELAGMGDTPLSKLSKPELDTIWKVMQVLEHSIARSNDMLGQSRYAKVSEVAGKLREDTDGLRRRSQWAEPLGMMDGGLNLDMLTPETYFHKLGEAGDDLFQQMRRAQDKQVSIQGDILEKFQKACKESGQKAWQLEREMHSFDVSGGEVTLTTAQIMELYALSRREQAIEHLYIGGIRPEAVRKGLKMEGGGRAVALTPEDVAKVTGTLTKEQKTLADRMQNILSNDLSAYGNEASMEVYGYEKFKEKNYWPIKVGSEDTKTNPAAKAAAKTIPGYGMTKAVQPNARNPVVLHSAFDTFARHVTEMSTYAGWLGTNENATRLLNYRFQDAEGNQDGTVKDRLKHIHGAGGDAYLEKLLGDIAQGTKAGRDTVFSSGGMTGAFKSSAISANLRVILQQPTAILRAMEMVSPKYFATGLGQKELMKGWETAKKYAPIAQWKDWGYFEMDTGRSYKELMLGPKNTMGKIKSAAMSPAGWADAVGWGYLWKISEAETADKHKDLKKGSEEFYQKTAERFGEIVDRTQVVDSVLHRTQLMRSNKDLHKMASSFMSEPSKQYNEIVRGLYDFTRAGAKGDAKGKSAALKHLVRTAAAMSLSFAVNALAQSGPDMWRDDDRDKSNLEKFKENWWENFKSNYNPTGYVPYAKDLWSVVDSALIHKNAFGGDVSRMDMEVVTDIAKAAKQAVDAYNGDGKKSKVNAYLDAANQLCRAAGLPLQTIKRDAAGIAGWWMQATGNNEGLYQMDKLLYEEENDTQRFVGHLYRAMNEDWEQYQDIYKDMAENWEQYGGGEEDWTRDKFQEKIQDAVERRMAKEAGLEKPSSLPVEYSAPGENLTFDQEIMWQLTRGGSWMDTLPEGTLELARDLEQLEPEGGADSVTKMQKIRELRDSIWGNEVKELTLENILGDADYKRMQAARKAGISIEKWCQLYEAIADHKIKRTGKSGSPSQADVSAVLEKSGLTEKQKDAIWQGYGWKGERVKEQDTESGSQLPGLRLPSLR